jgi:L-threonylcarbamoyladenylate synthase
MFAHDLGRAADAIRAGGVVAYATESCFGLGCNPLNRQAVERLLQLKGRPASKGLILIGAHTSQLAPFVNAFPRKALATWPGPYTWLLEPSKKTPPWIRGQHVRIAVRVTRHPQAAALCRAAGMAIVSTSLNRAGEKPARTYREVLRRFGEELDYVLAGRIGERKQPTPITDAATGEIVRSG